MPLQNRVNPYGEMAAVTSRGAWMGNRGYLHTPSRAITNVRWTSRAWIICELSYRGKQRTIMAPDSYTELFFLDEATALAAGHRPCGKCRKVALKEFMSKWHASKVPAKGALATFDDALHFQRAPVVGKADLPLVDFGAVPDGCIIALARGGDPHLVLRRKVLRWSFDGYDNAQDVPEKAQVILITPRVTKDIIARGYQPQIHPSAA
jgi:hypothetical protein